MAQPPWKFDFTPEVEAWLTGLGPRDRRRIDKALALLERGGPSLGRPAVDSVKRSRHHNMKELRSFGGHLRILFAFSNRTAVMLVGGDKRGSWERWYKDNIKVADERLDRHQREHKEAPWRRTGDRSRDIGR